MIGTNARSLERPVRMTFPVNRLLLIILLVVAGVGISHAVIRHGQIVAEIRAKCNQQGPPQWINDVTGRGARWCIIREHNPENGQRGKLGYQIMEKVNGTWEEITAFPQKVNAKLTVEEAVAKYLNNTGYGLP